MGADQDHPTTGCLSRCDMFKAVDLDRNPPQGPITAHPGYGKLAEHATNIDEMFTQQAGAGLGIELREAQGKIAGRDVPTL